MSKNSFIFISTSVLLVLLVLSALFIKSRQAVSTTALLPPQEQSVGEMDVKVTPLTLKVSETPQFKIEFNTHSIELDFDIIQVASLVDDRGQNYGIPIWEGSPPGGHHRSGTLSFSTSLKSTKAVKLSLKITDTPELTFSWEI